MDEIEFSEKYFFEAELPLLREHDPQLTERILSMRTKSAIF